MKRLHYLLLFLIPFVYSCDPDPVEVEQEACAEGDALDQLNCKVGFSEWRIKSVTSDVARPHTDGPTRDWTQFRPECHNNSFLDLSGFLPTSDTTDSVVNFFDIEADSDACTNDTGNFLESDEDFESASVLYGEEYSTFFYGIPFAQRGAIEETWYGIQFKKDEYLKFLVDKTFEKVDYQVSVELEPVR